MKREPQTTEAAKTRTRRFRLCTYDVLGNAEDGWDVNDVFGQHTVDIVCNPQIYNEGKENEFVSHDPTEQQLTQAVEATGELNWEGESDFAFYATDPTNGYPVGELQFVGFVDEDGNLIKNSES